MSAIIGYQIAISLPNKRQTQLSWAIKWYLHTKLFPKFVDKYGYGKIKVTTFYPSLMYTSFYSHCHNSCIRRQFSLSYITKSMDNDILARRGKDADIAISVNERSSMKEKKASISHLPLFSFEKLGSSNLTHVWTILLL